MSGEHGFDEGDVDVADSAALRSQVSCAVLGLVIEKPSHGYEIARRFEVRFGAFLSAQRSAVYSALKGLRAAGLIEKMPGQSSTGVRRGAKPGASYRATARGARAYRRLLAERVQNDPSRAEMLGRMILAGVHSVEAALDFLDHFEQGCVQQAKQLALSAGGETSDVGGVSGLVERLLIEERRGVIDADLAWITRARAELRALRDGVETDV
ncbi:MAG TPA: PadR family transcriptional regulator [Solirubrobacteraceae bacterium]|nr:PadR family transcriptional regulator [Solirubrobacteraceae bacterium]